MYKNQNDQIQTNIFKIHKTERKKLKKLKIDDLLGTTFNGLIYFNLSALFLNASTKSIRLVVEDLGVYEIHEKPSCFDDYEDVEDEIED